LDWHCFTPGGGETGRFGFCDYGAGDNDAGADGLLFGNPGLLRNQIVAVLATSVYAFAVTWLLRKVLDWTMGLRVSEEEEENGLDLSQHNETGYNI